MIRLIGRCLSSHWPGVISFVCGLMSQLFASRFIGYWYVVDFGQLSVVLDELPVISLVI